VLHFWITGEGVYDEEPRNIPPEQWHNLTLDLQEETDRSRFLARFRMTDSLPQELRRQAIGRLAATLAPIAGCMASEVEVVLLLDRGGVSTEIYELATPWVPGRAGVAVVSCN
jgi:hypothetical protein